MGGCSMVQQQIKELFSKEIIPDTTEGLILKEILFDRNNDIDWDKALEIVKEYMPEIKEMYVIEDKRVIK